MKLQSAELKNKLFTDEGIGSIHFFSRTLGQERLQLEVDKEIVDERIYCILFCKREDEESNFELKRFAWFKSFVALCRTHTCIYIYVQYIIWLADPRLHYYE